MWTYRQTVRCRDIAFHKAGAVLPKVRENNAHVDESKVVRLDRSKSMHFVDRLGCGGLSRYREPWMARADAS